MPPLPRSYTESFSFGLAVLIVFSFTILEGSRCYGSRGAIAQTSQGNAGTEVSTAHPEHWKKIDNSGLVTFYVPADLKSAQVVGNHRGSSVAFSGPGISYVTFNYDSGTCELPRNLTERSTLERLTMDIHGRQARLTIDRDNMPKSIIARACFAGVGENGSRLYVMAICNNNRGLETWKRILSTVEFP